MSCIIHPLLREFPSPQKILSHRFSVNSYLHLTLRSNCCSEFFILFRFCFFGGRDLPYIHFVSFRTSYKYNHTVCTHLSLFCPSTMFLYVLCLYVLIARFFLRLSAISLHKKNTIIYSGLLLVFCC